ncbi:GLPGLI family protein [Ornithobacterium rhinotracheale]|uniref:GLPGLI family protein n=1 Tax=Ornithobacterium rhinotracheale TaxID=28251 RepID=UPI0040359D02
MRKLLLLISFLYFVISLAQPAQLNVSEDPYDHFKLDSNAPFYGREIKSKLYTNEKPYHEKSLGENIQNIYYNYKTLPNPKNKKKQKTGLTILQIGENILKFTDRAILKNDSLKETFAKKGVTDTNDIYKGRAITNMAGFDTNVFNDLKTKQTTIQNALILSGLEYTIPTPQLKWTLQKDQKEILGYAVQKATTQYGGREWVAWFAKDIPLSYGPYLFGGLPGLILEMHDTEDEHHFTAIAMSTTPRPFYKRIYEWERKTSEEKALNALKERCEDRLFRPFNPIEKL